MADLEAASLKVKLSTEGDDEAGRKVESLGKRIDNVGKSSVKTGSMLTLGLTTPILAFGAASIMSASNTEEAQAKVNTVFGNSSGIITEWSGTTSQALGLSKQDALAATGTFGNMFTSMGMGQEQAANLSTGMVQLAVDTASFNNASTDEALLAMQSALTGEYDALKKYGIVLNDATLSQTAMTMGLGDNFSALTEQEKVLVRQQAIMDQSKNATGDFSRTQGGLANQIKIAKAEFENITATLGAMFLPMVTKAMVGVGKLLAKFQTMSPGMQKVIVVVAGLAAAIGPLLIGLGMGIRVIGQVSQAVKGLSMAMKLLTANPIGLLVMAIAGLVVLGIHLYKNWEPFRKLVDKIADALKDFISGPVLDFIKDLIDGAKDAWQAFKTWADGITSWSDMFSKVGDVLRDVGGWVRDLASQVANLDWNSLLKGAWSAIQTSLELAWDSIASIDWMAVIGQAVEVGQKVFDWTKETLGKIEWMAILGKAKDIGEAVFTWTKETLGAIEWQKLFGQAVNIGSDILSWVKNTLGSIDWMSLLGSAVDIGSNILQWARDTLGSINWGALLGAAVEIGTAIFTWAKDTLGSIDWGRLIGQAKEVGANVLSWITDTLGSIDWGRLIGAAKEVGTSIFNWTKGLLVSIKWSDMFGTMLEVAGFLIGWVKEMLVSIAWTDLFGAAGELFSDTLTWIKEKLDVPKLDVPSFEDIYAMVLAEVKAWLGVGGSNPDSNGDGLVEPHEQNPDLVGEPQQGFAGAGMNFDVKGAGNFAAMLQPIVDAANNARAAVTLFNGESQKTPPILGQSQSAAPVYSGAFENAALAVRGSGSSILGTLTGIAGNTLAQMSAARSSAGTQIGQMVSDVIGKTTNMRLGANTQFTTMAGDALAKAQQTMGNMTSGIAGGLGAVAANFITMKTNANSRMSEMASSATTQGNSTMSNMVGSLAGGMARVAITLMGLNTAVSSAGSSAASTAYSIGSNISSSFASGMNAFLDRIRAAAGAMVAAASAALIAKAQIASPSKLFMGFGAYVGEGFEAGITSMIPSVAKASADLVATPLLAAPGMSSMPVSGRGNSGGVTVVNHHNYVLRSEELVDLMEKAEKGSSHATAWQNPEAFTQFLKKS